MRNNYWAQQLHNAWLGSGLIAGALLIVLERGFLPCEIQAGKRFMFLFWLRWRAVLFSAI